MLELREGLSELATVAQILASDTQPLASQAVTSGGVTQETAMLVMLASPTFPLPFNTLQVWPEGWVSTVTS